MERDKAKVRALTREERELYAPFIQSKSAREQLVKAIDNISLAAYTGNVIITGEEGMDTLSLAKAQSAPKAPLKDRIRPKESK